jgi:excisionase family DNA binding protein
MEMTDFISIDEFCKMTGFKKNTVYQYLSKPEKKIPSYRFGRFVRFKRSEVIEFINSNTKIYNNAS